MAVARTVSAFRPHHGHPGHLCEKETCFDAPHQYENEIANPKRLIRQALHRRVAAIDCNNCEPGDEDAFYVADLGEIYRQHQRWERNLPRVKPFYAVKCNPDPNVLRLLAKLGTGFDCASKTEINHVLDAGASCDRIIYAQPCKTSSYIRFAKSVGVKRMTFDNADELYKIAQHYPDAQLFLRIITNDVSSMNPLSMKFGATMDATDDLLAVAKRLRLNVVGVSFHVGTGASDPAVFYEAVRDSYTVFQKAHEIGLIMRSLDIGGGFQSSSFENMAAVLTRALEEYFPRSSNVEIIAEPGRYYVSSAFTVACNIIARRSVSSPKQNNQGYMVYVNDGMYGSFLSVVFGHKKPVPRVLYAGGKMLYDSSVGEPCSAMQGFEYSVWGPTCDGMDCISTGSRLNLELTVGDWLYFEDMGAYAMCTASGFNGFPSSFDIAYVCSDPRAAAILE